MTAKKPRFITFGISHYGEKARWALDWHGVDYGETGWPPGWHVVLAKWHGAKHSTVPILLDGKRVIQGSGAIIGWADRQAGDASRRLTSPGALEIERRADDGVGVNVRRLFYAGILHDAPHVVKPALLANTSPLHRLIGNILWPVTRRVIMMKYETGPGAMQESHAKLGIELDWLDSLLADGRQYLSGGRFSRADITVASLLAPLVRPEQMKVYHEIAVPEALAAVVECWRDRPIMRWTAELYRTGRAGMRSQPRSGLQHPPHAGETGMTKKTSYN